MYILFQILFLFRLLQNTEYISQWYRVGLCISFDLKAKCSEKYQLFMVTLDTI